MTTIYRKKHPLCRGRTFAALLAAGALTFACLPLTAWAENNTGTTEVTVEADPNAMLLFRVPTLIPFYAAPDGVLTGPTPSACQVVNESVFGIHVTQVGVTPKGGWNIEADAPGATTENAMDFQFGPECQVEAFNALEGMQVAADPSFNMGYAGSGEEALDIITAGDVARVTLDLSQPVPSSTIQWTVAPGYAAEA